MYDNDKGQVNFHILDEKCFGNGVRDRQRPPMLRLVSLQLCPPGAGAAIDLLDVGIVKIELQGLHLLHNAVNLAAKFPRCVRVHVLPGECL